jgi:hypothetical protein
VQKPATSSDQDPGTTVTLWAFAATDLSHPLVSLTAGTFTHAVNSNANLIPTVANGKVYVASNKQLRIFGLFSAKTRAAVVPKSLRPSAPDVVRCGTIQPVLAAVVGALPSAHELYGTVCQVSGTELQMNLRTGRSVKLDTTNAFTHNRRLLLTPGRPVHVVATIDAKGLAYVQKISPSHMISSETPRDR